MSSVIIRILSFLKTGKFPRYTHVFMNCDNIEDPLKRDEYKFVEADLVGVNFSTFTDVFHCDYVCLLSPKSMSNEEWTKVIDKLISSIGTPYDDLFDLADRSRMSCVEVVLTALEAADYEEDFANLEAMILAEGNLLPQMYRDCPDFIVAYEK